MKLNFLKNKFKSIKEKFGTANLKNTCSRPYLKSKWKEFRETPQSISKTCAILCIYTMLVFNIPAFKVVLGNTENGSTVALTFVALLALAPLSIYLFRFMQKKIGYIRSSIILVFTLIALLLNIDFNWNGMLIFSSVTILMYTLTYFLYYTLLWLGRTVGKVIISLTFIISAVCLYSIHAFEANITDATIANVFNTRDSEASSFLTPTTITTGIMYIIFLGVPPIIYLFAKKIKYSKFWRFITSTIVSLLIVILVLFANMRNILWIDQNATMLGGRIMPWSYIVNTARHLLKKELKEIKLPDAQITTESKDVCVLIIGESARRENFSLYGYERITNPLLAGDSVTAYIAESDDVSTIGGVKAILSYKSSSDLYEILPNYLCRTGVDVIWRTSNWGEPPLHIEADTLAATQDGVEGNNKEKKYWEKNALIAKYPNEDSRYDGVLFAGLAEEIENSEKDKQLIVIHCYTSHGPKYHANYPAEFEKFTPVCTSVEVASVPRQHLVNAYDNTILYTDYLVHSVIETLKQITDKRCCMIFVSDHGESLGEGNMYMHGTLPRRYAPSQQCEIPFIVWENDSNTKTKELDKVEQFYVYHSVLNWFGIESPIYNENMNVFEPVNIDQDGTAQ